MLEPENGTVQVYRPEKPPQQFVAHDQFSLPDIVPGWQIAAAEFFDF